MRAIRNLLVLITMFASTGAEAASGHVTGRLLFYQNQGNFCPSTRDCSGTTYQEAEFNTYSPVSDVIVYLKVHNSSTVLGQGTTDTSGNYVISWVSGDYPIQADIVWHAEHKDGRFAIHTPDGFRWHLWSDPFDLDEGTTEADPQDLGDLAWGEEGAPNEVANVYDGAFRTWGYALQYSDRMWSYFAELSIRAFSDVPCSTSCARGSENTIYLDEEAAYSPQARVMHEMGHIAVYVSNPFKSVSNYCYPDTECMNPGWNATSPEWKSGSFNEGIASFIASVAIYWDVATAPHTCWASAEACPDDSFNLETSPYLDGGDCQEDQDRWELSAERFLWDIYDRQEENFVVSGDFDTLPYYTFFDRLADFPNGTDEYEDDEPWNSARTSVDDYDGRSGEDMEYWFDVGGGFNPYNQRAINCDP